MMMCLVTSLINRFLSPYVDELTASQLDIFAWSGQATLTNVALKASALDAFKLPLRVVHGAIGRIEATVPWMNLYSEPIIFRISDVYLLALPNWQVTGVFTPEEEQRIAWEAKKAALESIEAIKQKIRDEQAGKKENDGFLVKLLVAALKNIQIFVDRVHVLYEDSSTYQHYQRQKVLQIGCLFSKLIFRTEDNADASRTTTSTTNDLLINKLIRLEGFSLYMNTKSGEKLHGLPAKEINRILQERITLGEQHSKKKKKKKKKEKSTKKTATNHGNLEYILCPINFNTDAVVHRQPEADAYRLPIVDLRMKLDYFRLQLSNGQIEAALLLLKAVERARLAAPSLKWRPVAPIQVSPTQWWTFLVTATLEVGLRPRKRQFRWPTIERCCKARKAYSALYKRRLLGELAPPVEASLAELERLERHELTLIAIVLGRSQAETAAAVEARRRARQQQHQQQNAQQNPGAQSPGAQNPAQNNNQARSPNDGSSRSWFSRRFWGFWGASPEEDRHRQLDPTLLDLKETFLRDGEERAKLYQAIGYSEERDRWILYPAEYIAHRATFCINMLKIVVKEEEVEVEKGTPAEKNPQTPTRTSLLNVEFDTCRFDVAHRPSSGNLLLTVALSRLTIIGVDNVMLLKGRQGERQLLGATIELAPLDRLADLRVHLQLRSIYLLYDIETISRLYGAVLGRSSRKAGGGGNGLTLEEFQSLAQRHRFSASLDWRLLVESAFERHKQLQLDVTVEPSYLIIPRAGAIATAEDVVLLSLGKLILTSKLVPKSNRRKVHWMLTAAGSGTGGGLEMLVYERYSVHVRNVQLVLSDRSRWSADLDLLHTERHVVFPFEIYLDVGRSIVPSEAVHFPKVTISGTIPKIEVNTSDEQFSTLLGLLISLPYLPKTMAKVRTQVFASQEQPQESSAAKPPAEQANNSSFELTRKASIANINLHLEVAEAASYAAKVAEEKSSATSIGSLSTVESRLDDVPIGSTASTGSGSVAFESNIFGSGEDVAGHTGKEGSHTGHLRTADRRKSSGGSDGSDEGQGRSGGLQSQELKFEFSLNRAVLTVFAGSRRPEVALGQTTLVELAVQGEVLSGGSSPQSADHKEEQQQVVNVHCTVADLVMEDTRQCREASGGTAGIKRMLEKMNSTAEDCSTCSILSIRLAQTSNQLAVVVALSSLRYSFALDYLLTTIEVVTKAFAFLDQQDQTTENVPQPVQASNAQENSLLSTSVQIDLDKVEVILLESLEVPDAVACICNCAVTFSLQADPLTGRVDMTGRVLQATVGVANYLTYVGTNGAVTGNHLDEYLMSPAEMELVGVVLGPRQKFHLRFSDIYISISPHTGNIVLGILSSMGSFSNETSSAANLLQSEPAVGDNFIASTPSSVGSAAAAAAAGGRGGSPPADFLLPKPIDRQRGWFARATASSKCNLSSVKATASLLNDGGGGFEEKEQEVKAIDLPESQIITIRVDKIRLLIKNGGSQGAAPLPLIRFSLKLKARLVNGVRFTFICPVLADYFNTSIFAWEPLLEPVDGAKPLEVEGEVLVISPEGGEPKSGAPHYPNPNTSKSSNLESTTKVTLTIAETMELLLTRSSISTLTTAATEFTSEIFSDGTGHNAGVLPPVAAANPSQLKYHENRINVHNCLGIPLKVDLAKSGLSVLQGGQSSSRRRSYQRVYQGEEGDSGTVVVIDSGGSLSLITTDCRQSSSTAAAASIIALHVSLAFGSCQQKSKKGVNDEKEGEVVVVQRSVNCSSTAIRCYFTTVTSEAYPDDPWKWIVQVQDVSTNVSSSSNSGNGNASSTALGPTGKEVIFRSNTQIDNYFDIPLRLYTFDGTSTQVLGTVGANASFYLPLSVVYGRSMVYLRPSLDYKISDVPVDWRTLDVTASSSEEDDELEQQQLFKLGASLLGCSKEGGSSEAKLDPRHWPPLKALILLCDLKEDPEGHCRRQFTVKVRGEKVVVLFEDTERLNVDEAFVYHVKLVPLVRLRNLLPYQMQFSYYSLRDKVPQFIALNCGEEKILPYADFGKTHITYQVLNYLGHSWSTTPQLLPETGCKNEDHYYTFFELEEVRKTINQNPKKKSTKTEVPPKKTITLAVKFLVEGHSLTLSVFAPYWVVNQTGEELVYKVHGRMNGGALKTSANCSNSALFSQHLFRHPQSLQKQPYLLAFNPNCLSTSAANSFFEVNTSPSAFKKNSSVKLVVSVKGSHFSDPFPLNVVPFSGSLHPLSAKKSFRFALSVRVELARIGVSKIVTLSSFYNVFNISKRVVQFSETGKYFSTIASFCSKVFFPRKEGDEQRMCFRFKQTPTPSVSSMFISLRSSSQTLLPIGDTDVLFVEVDVSEGVEAKIKLSDYFYGAAPVLVVNDLPVAIYYGQRLEDQVGDRKKPESKAAKVGTEVKKKLATCVSDGEALDGDEEGESGCFTLLPAKHTAFYCWADPLAPRELVYRLPGERRGRRRRRIKKEKINLDFDRYQTMDPGEGTSLKECWWITFFDGKQRVLVFTDDRQLPQLLLNTDELSKPTFSLELIIKGIGLDLVDDKRKRDLLYLTIRSSHIWEESAEADDDDQLPSFHEMTTADSAALEEMYQLYRSYNQAEPSSLSHSSFARKNVFLRHFEAHFGPGPGEPMRLLAPRQALLRRTSRRGLCFSYAASTHITQYHLKVASLQVDNQLPEHIFPVALSPVVHISSSSSSSYPTTASFPKAAALMSKRKKKHDEGDQKKVMATPSPPSFIEVVAIVQSMTSVTRYKNLQVLVQEFCVRVDWGWIAEILALFNIVEVGFGDGGLGDYTGNAGGNGVPEFSTRMLIYQDLEAIVKNNTLLEMQKFVMRKTYYDYLLFGPLRAHISVSVGSLPPDGRYPFGIDFLIRFTGLTVGDISDSVLRLDGFERKRLSCSDAELVSSVIGHYKRQVYAQVYKLFLGLDIMGNPMKLALGLQKGFGDLVYQPAMGARHGPEAFVDGLAVGVHSLSANVIGGTAAALGRIGHRLGTGLAALTIDERFQRERRERLATRRPSLAEAARCLLAGFANGVGGLVRQPLDGLREEAGGGGGGGAGVGARLEALLRGIGRGVVGTILQPATGAVDCGAVLLRAFHALIDPAGAAAAAGALPVRPPRHFPGGTGSRNVGRLMAYSLYAAQGNQILRGVLEAGNRTSRHQHSSSAGSAADYAAVDYGDEEYEYHLQISAAQKGLKSEGNSSLVLLTSRRLLHLSSSTFFSSTSELWEVDWAEEWPSLASVAREGHQLRLTMVRPSQQSMQQQQQSPKSLEEGGDGGLFYHLCFCGGSGSSAVTRTLVDADEGHVDDLYEKIQRHLKKG